MLRNLSNFHYTQTFLSKRAAGQLTDATLAYQYAPTPQASIIQIPLTGILLVTVCFINFLAVLLQDSSAVDLLCGCGETLEQGMSVLSMGNLRAFTGFHTFAAFHSSSAMTTPSMISIPLSPPSLPVAWSSFRTRLFSFLLCTSSSRLLPSIPFRFANFFSAGSAGTMMAIGLLLSLAACTQMLPTSVADR